MKENKTRSTTRGGSSDTSASTDRMNRKSGEVPEKVSSRKEQKCAKPSLYDLLGVAKDSTPAEVTRAYRRKALVLHPDKVRQKSAEFDTILAEASEKELTSHFQELQAAYEILKDSKKRKIYDETGETDSDMLNGSPFEEAYAFFRDKFPKVKPEDIDFFRVKYIGSEEELDDIQEFYEKFNGDLTHFFEYIPFSDESQVSRYRDIINELLNRKVITSIPAYVRTLPKFDKTAKSFSKKTVRESKSSKSGDISDLVLAIQGRNAAKGFAGNAFLKNLEERYSKKSKKK